MNFNKDINGQIEFPSFILCNKGGKKIGKINGVSNIIQSNNLNSPDEFSFTVSKSLCQVWNDITDFKLVYVPQISEWYEISINVTDEDATTMSVSAIHAQEAELSQINLYETQFNTQSDSQLQNGVPTLFYNQDDPKHSLLNRILSDKAQHYQIYHVDASLKNINRMYSFDGVSILDALQQISSDIGVLFRFGEGSQKDGKIHRTISAYDLYDYCTDCGERQEYMFGTCPNCGSKNIIKGYGEESKLTVTKESLGDNLKYDCNKDDVKTCFRLVAGDDDMTSAVINCNPNGSQYLWYFSDDMKNDMSEDLVNKLNEYDEKYKSYVSTKEITGVPDELIAKYNEYYEKYKSQDSKLQKFISPIVGFTNLMRDYYYSMEMASFLETTMHPYSQNNETTTAASECKKLLDSDISSIGTRNVKLLSSSSANNIIIRYSKIFVNSALYRITVQSSNYDSSSYKWNGKIVLESYTDKTDKADTGIINIQFSQSNAEYVRWEIGSMMKQKDAKSLGAVNTFKLSDDNFKSALQQYSLNNLNIFKSCADASLDIIDKMNFSSKETDVLSQREKYYSRQKMIQDEIKIRQEQLSYIKAKRDNDNKIVDGVNKGIIDYLDDIRIEINNDLNIKNFLGDDLWEELSAWRRQDQYQNSSFVSDDLDDSQIITRALEFIDYAKKQIVKSATLQHSITGNIKDFLLLKEFNEYDFDFRVGNWIHLVVDDKIFKLRLTSIEVDYSNLSSITVEFSDVIKGLGVMSDVKSIFDKAKSIATNYSYVKHSADNSVKTKNIVDTWVNDGLDLTKMQIVNNASNQQMQSTGSGTMFRKYDPVTGTYDSEQVKILGNGVYFTADEWKTLSVALGKFKIQDPQNDFKQVTKYGVIADTLVGNLILGNNIGIYNKAGSIKATDDGITITSDTTATNPNLLTIQKKNSDGTKTKYVYIDENGDIRINGNSISISSEGFSNSELGSYIDNNLTDTSIMDKLTKGGNRKGIYLSDGELYLNASMIKTGIIKDNNGYNYWNMDTGDFSVKGSGNSDAIRMKNGKLSIDATNISVTGLQVGSNVTMGKNAVISWSDISGRPSSLSDFSNDMDYVTGSGATVIAQDAISSAYISASRITAGTLNAGNITLRGYFNVYGGGTIGYMQGNTGFASTDGIGMVGPGSNYYVLATTAGVVMGQDGGAAVLVTGAGCHIGNISTSSVILQAKNIYLKGNAYLNGNALATKSMVTSMIEAAKIEAPKSK